MMKKPVLLIASLLLFCAVIYFLFYATHDRNIHLNVLTKGNKEIKPLTTNQIEVMSISESKRIIDSGVVVSTSPQIKPMKTKGIKWEINSDEIVAFTAEKAPPTSVTVAGHMWYKRANTLTRGQVQKFIRPYFKKPYAVDMAKVIHNQIRSPLFKKATVFITATAAILTVEEFLFSGISFWMRFTIAVVCGLIILIIYNKLSEKIMN